jgi:hypothetical protein
LRNAAVGDREPKIENPFSKVLYKAVCNMDWQEVLADPPPLDDSATVEEEISYYLSTPDDRLNEHMRTLLLTCSDSRARRNKTPAHDLARKIIKVYLDQVDWENVYEKYKNS